MFRKAQIKMFETIAVLFVFFILLTLGLIFYGGVEKKKIQQEQREFNQMKAIENAQMISFLPELECPTSLEADNCIDLYKIKAIIGSGDYNDNIFNKNVEYYYDILGYTTITVKQIYPAVSLPNGEWMVYNNTPGGIISVSKIQIPVSLYDAIDKAYKFAILDIDIYG